MSGLMLSLDSHSNQHVSCHNLINNEVSDLKLRCHAFMLGIQGQTLEHLCNHTC